VVFLIVKEKKKDMKHITHMIKDTWS